MPLSHEKNKHLRMTVYQLRATVASPCGSAAAQKYVVERLLPFIAKSLYAKIPDEAIRLQNFELINAPRRCECISVPDRLLWTVRFRFPAKDKTMWFYDIAMIEKAGELLFGIKIETDAGNDLKAAQERIFLPDMLLSEIGLLQVRPISEKPWLIDNPDEVGELVCFLNSPRRSLPVILISAVNRNHWSFTPTPPDYLVNAEYLASHVKGYAHVVRLGFRAAFEFSGQVGRSWSTYDGACRTYFSNVDFEKGLPSQHVCNRKDIIWFWKYADQNGPHAYTSFLIDMAHRTVSTNRINWQNLYFVPDARILQAELQLAHAAHTANAPERELAMQKHIDALQRKLGAAEEENNDWLDELDHANEAVEFYKQENVSLRLQLDAMRMHLMRQSGQSPDDEIPIPDHYRELPDWVCRHLAGRLVLLPRAERAVVKAEYGEAGMVYRALLILANEYRDSRLGLGSDHIFRSALAKYGMEFSGSIDKARAGQEGDAYFVNYPLGTNDRVMLKFHIERGNSREPRYCMRIYFFWDEDTSQVVVGWLPSHLNNRAT